MSTGCISFNVEYAYKFGAMAGLFLSALESAVLFISDKDASVSLSSEQIYNFCGMSRDEQEAAELILLDKNAISIRKTNSPNRRVYTINHVNIFNCEIPRFHKAFSLDELRTAIPVDKKKQERVNKLKNAITVNNPVIKAALCDWIDVLEESKKSQTVKGIEENMKTLLQRGASEKLMLDAIRACIKNGWRDLSFGFDAISTYSTQDNSFEAYSKIKDTGNDFIREGF